MGDAERTHVALLRGVNVVGRNRISMPALRQAVESLGHGGVITYIQSGNVLFAARRPDAADREIAAGLEAVIAERTGVRAAVIVLRKEELRRALDGNPFAEVSDHRRLHAVFLGEPPDAAGLAAVAAAVGRARERGSPDDARVVGRVLYLSTPEGFARSVLRVELDRRGARSTPMHAGTARNWATVLALADLMGR